VDEQGVSAHGTLDAAGGNQALVQLYGGGDGASGTHEAAAAGVAGASAQLPHLGAIQQAFGKHDVSGVRSQAGGAAADACGAMGASAYASGDKVAFKGGSPDLHTAAHEAAHVVQQRQGVSLSGGVGKSGDGYERHADAVADAVVSGRSAEGLLDQGAGGGGATQAVQRSEDVDPEVADLLALAEQIGQLDGVFLTQTVHIRGSQYGFIFVVQPNIDLMFNDILAREYTVHCAADVWQMYAAISHALTGSFEHIARPGRRAGSYAGSDGVSAMVAERNLEDSMAVLMLESEADRLSAMGESGGAVVPLSISDLMDLEQVLTNFTEQLRPMIQRETGALLRDNLDQLYDSPADDGPGSNWQTIDELQVEVDAAIVNLKENFVPQLRTNVDETGRYYVSIQEEHDTFADFLGSTLQGGAAGPEELFDVVGRGLNFTQRLLNSYDTPGFPFSELDGLGTRCRAMNDSVNALIAAVEAHAEHRDAQHALGESVIDAALTIASTLLVPYFSGGVGGIAGHALSIGTSVAMSATRQQLVEGRVDWGETLSTATLSLVTSGVGGAVGDAVADRLTPMLERAVANNPALQRLATEAFGDTERFMAIARQEISGISGDLISQAMEVSAAALTGGEVTWDDLLEETAINLASGVVSRRMEHHAEEQRAARERQRAEAPGDGPAADAPGPEREMAELAPAQGQEQAGQRGQEAATQAAAPNPGAQTRADAQLLYEMGRITEGDQARIYSASTPEEAQSLLIEAIASHHDAATPGGNYVELALALERDGIAQRGTAVRIATAADDWQRQVFLDDALDNALRTDLFTDYQAAEAAFRERVAADPTREFALVELRTGGYGVVRGEARMVPIQRQFARIVMHNHPQGADGQTDALTAMPSLTGGDVSVGMEESARTGQQYSQGIVLSFQSGQVTVPLVTDAQNNTYWFDVPTPHGDSIRVSHEGGTFYISRGTWRTTAATERDVMQWFNVQWNQAPDPGHG